MLGDCSFSPALLPPFWPSDVDRLLWGELFSVHVSDCRFVALFCSLWKTSRYLVRNRTKPVWTSSVVTEIGFSGVGSVYILVQWDARLESCVLADVCGQSTWLIRLSEAFSRSLKTISPLSLVDQIILRSIFHPLLFVNKINKFINYMNISTDTILVVFATRVRQKIWIVLKYWFKILKWLGLFKGIIQFYNGNGFIWRFSVCSMPKMQ